jgi:SprT protein
MSNISEEIKLAILNKVNACVNKILGGPHDSVNITIDYRTDMGTTAGLAYRVSQRIEFNEILLLANLEKFINNTVPHEVVHILQFVLFRSAKQPHGPEWKRIMGRLGVDAATYHSYDVGPVKTKPTFRYVCGCEDRVFRISKIVHNKMINGQVRTCPSCKTRAVYFPEGDQ